MYDVTHEIDYAEDRAKYWEQQDILQRAPDIIEAARNFVGRYRDFQPDAPGLEAELTALLAVLRQHDDPEQDGYVIGAPVLADQVALVIYASDMKSDDPVICYWRHGR